MAHKPDAGLEAVLDLRRETLDQVRLELAERQRSYGAAADAERAAAAALDKAHAVVHHLQASPDLDVGDLLSASRYQDWCEVRHASAREASASAAAAVDAARTVVAEAHQRVRAIELVLQGRADERARTAGRVEARIADDIASRAQFLLTVGVSPR